MAWKDTVDNCQTNWESRFKQAEFTATEMTAPELQLAGHKVKLHTNSTEWDIWSGYRRSRPGVHWEAVSVLGHRVASVRGFFLHQTTFPHYQHNIRSINILQAISYSLTFSHSFPTPALHAVLLKPNQKCFIIWMWVGWGQTLRNYPKDVDSPNVDLKMRLACCWYFHLSHTSTRMANHLSVHKGRQLLGTSKIVFLASIDR